jgi:AcrR family transcriptional regulator
VSETKAVGVRARVRAELTAEIKQAATRQLATEGAAGLSLRAIARELGMASSAIYRYFASRDELLTALIIDAYNAAGDAVEQAEAACDREDRRGRFIAICGALRRWAIDNPNQWALIFGSPVPGYKAPEDTIDPATRVPTQLLTLLVELAVESGSTDPAITDPAVADPAMTEPAVAESGLADSLDGLMATTGGLVHPTALSAGLEAWAELVGLISLELFGHFNNVVADNQTYFDYAVARMADRVLQSAP